MIKTLSIIGHSAHLDKSLEDLCLPVLVVVCQSLALASVGLDHQSLHLHQQWTYGVVLSTESIQDIAPVLLLEVVVVLCEQV